MTKKEKISVELIRNSLLRGDFNPELTSTIEFIFELLSDANHYKFYDENLVSEELIDVYNKRLINLSAEGVKFGGFSETILSLADESRPSHMLTTDTEKYHISILVDDEIKVVGAIFVEH